MAIRKRAYLNWQYSSSPNTFHTTELQTIGHLGRIFEDSYYRGQLFQLVDGGVVAGDALYYKSYNSLTVTPTIGNSSLGEIAGFATTTASANEYIMVAKGGTFDLKANGVFARGTPVWPDTGNNRVIPGGVFSGSLSAAADTAGAILALENPCSTAAIITALIINRTTASTGAGTADFGTAANGTTLNDGLIDGLNLNATAANGENNFANGGTNGKPARYWPAGHFLTGSTASGAVAGLVGTYSGTFRIVGHHQVPLVGIAQAAISGGKVSTLIDLPYA